MIYLMVNFLEEKRYHKSLAAIGLVRSALNQGSYLKVLTRLTIIGAYSFNTDTLSLLRSCGTIYQLLLRLVTMSTASSVY